MPRHSELISRVENATLINKNTEIIGVMKTLEDGVKRLQAEISEQLSRNSELDKTVRSKDGEISLLKEQLGLLFSSLVLLHLILVRRIDKFQERNKVLSNKCSDMLGGQEKYDKRITNGDCQPRSMCITLIQNEILRG